MFHTCIGKRKKMGKIRYVSHERKYFSNQIFILCISSQSYLLLYSRVHVTCLRKFSQFQNHCWLLKYFPLSILFCSLERPFSFLLSLISHLLSSFYIRKQKISFLLRQTMKEKKRKKKKARMTIQNTHTIMVYLLSLFNIFTSFQSELEIQKPLFFSSNRAIFNP